MIINIILAVSIIQLPALIGAVIFVKWELKKLGFKNIAVNDKTFRVPFSFVYPPLVTLFIIVYIILISLFETLK